MRLFEHDLDAPARLEAELSKGLPADPQAARVVAWERVQDPSLASRFGAAYQGIVVALEVGVDRLPAVVFEADRDPTVVYGVDSLAEALGLYARWRERRP